MAKAKNLNGRRVMLTRADNESFKEKLEAIGAEVLELPLISVALEADAQDAAEILGGLGRYDWITFASPNGVRGFFKEFFKKYSDIRCIGPSRIACVGDGTAKALAQYYLQVDVIPQIQNAEGMAEAMMAFESLDNRNILCVGGNLSKKDFIKTLEEKGGAITDFFEVYKTSASTPKAGDANLEDFKLKGADFILFASGSAVESFAKNAASFALKSGAKNPKCISFGASATQAMAKYKMPLAAEVAEPSAEGLIAAIFKAV